MSLPLDPFSCFLLRGAIIPTEDEKKTEKAPKTLEYFAPPLAALVRRQGGQRKIGRSGGSAAMTGHWCYPIVDEAVSVETNARVLGPLSAVTSVGLPALP